MMNKAASSALKPKTGFDRNYRFMRVGEAIRRKVWRRKSTLRDATSAASAAARLEAQRSATQRDVRIAQVADALFSKGARHDCSFSNIGYVPSGNAAIPEVAFAGRSRCGSTALLRSLFKTRMAVDKGSSRGRRDVINAYAVGGGAFNIIETPGFGTGVVPWVVVLQHCSLLRAFCSARPNLKMLYYLLDVSEGAGLAYRDIDTLRFLSEEVKNFTIVLTKVDKNEDMASIYQQLQYHGIEHPAIATSAFTLGGVDALRFDIVSNVLHSLPSDRLSMAEVRRLGDRIYSAAQIASGAVGPPRMIYRPTSKMDELHMRWRQQLRLEGVGNDDEGAGGGAAAAAAGEPPGPGTNSQRAWTLAGTDGSDARRLLPATGNHTTASSDSASSSDAAVAAASALVATEHTTNAAAALTTTTTTTLPALAVGLDQLTTNYHIAGRSGRNDVAKFLRPLSVPQMQHVLRTSPWRNPYAWPSHVAVTFNKRVNVIKCPEDPDNPYLFQPKFATPRADWSFRRPSLAQKKKFAGKGKYLARAPEYFSRCFTVPFFPDIVDIRLHPQPVAFVGAATYYDHGPAGKQLALAMHAAATAPLTNVTAADVASQPAVRRISGLARMLIAMDDEGSSNRASDTSRLGPGRVPLPLPAPLAVPVELADRVVNSENNQRAVTAAAFDHPSF